MFLKHIHFLKKNSFRKFPFFSTRKNEIQNNYYDILELKSSCTQREIRKNYLRLAKTYHPDVYTGSDKDRFKKIKEAYETLKNPEKREEYDKKNSLKTDYPGATDSKPSEEEQGPAANLYKNWEEEEKKINIDREYQKFMGRESSVNPEKIIVSEDPLISQMNEVEKARMEYLNMRNNAELYKMKYGHQQTFNQTLTDTVNILNEGHNRKLKSKVELKEDQALWTKKIKKRFFWIQIMAIVIFLPFLINTASRRAYIKKQEKERIAHLQKMKSEQEMREVQERMVFDDK